MIEEKNKPTWVCVKAYPQHEYWFYKTLGDKVLVYVTPKNRPKVTPFTMSLGDMVELYKFMADTHMSYEHRWQKYNYQTAIVFSKQITDNEGESIPSIFISVEDGDEYLEFRKLLHTVIKDNSTHNIQVPF